MIKRHYDAKLLNKVVNDPTIIPWVRGNYKGEHLDLTPVVADRRNFCLLGEFGGVIFLQHQLGLYEAHTQFLPEGRGKQALAVVQEALHWMFTRTEAMEIVSKVPKGNLGARALVRSVHGRLEFRNPNGWTIRGQTVYADVFSWTLQEWLKTAPNLTEKGKWFHNKLESEFIKKGIVDPPHPDDEIHDRYVGATVEMAFGGQPHKAIMSYNRWAGMAGYAQVQIVSENPLVIDIQNSMVVIKDKDFWVI